MGGILPAGPPVRRPGFIDRATTEAISVQVFQQVLPPEEWFKSLA
jgi:hypothetical protein